MQLRALALALLAAAPARADDDGPVRTSLPTESDRAAWTEPGFRLALGVGYGELVGLGGAPGGRLLGPVLRLGYRADAAWSLMASFAYQSASKAGGLSGLRYAGTIEPTWHVLPGLAIAVGVGFGGIVEGRTGRASPDPQPGTLDASYTFPDASTPLPSCSGAGVAGLVRAEWLFVLGPRSATGAALELLGQWTGCEQATGVVEPDTGQPIVRRQWWPHVGGTLSWMIAWR
jgi:hypothetical protein